MEPIEIREARPASGAGEWDAFVRDHELGTPFHLTAWQRLIEKSFGYRNESLAAFSGGRMVGVVPLFLVSNFLTGKVLMSSPFAVYGGILAENAEAADALRERIARRGEELGVKFIELRNWDERQLGGWERVSRHSTFLKEMEKDGEAILAALPRETRRMTRRAVENNYEVRFTRDLGEFDRLYGTNLRKLGTPAFPSRHFENMLEEWPDADVMELRLEGKVVAAVLSLYHGDTVLPYYGASDPDYNRQNPNNMMYYGLMCEARRRGLKRFDFGRSKKESGAHLFKSHWGMEERELPYEFLLVKRKELPNFSPANPKFEIAIKAWQRLPLRLTRMLGPFLIRLFP